MFCPRCGILQSEQRTSEQRERCSRCASLLARPEARSLPPIRVVASPTRRGELAQRAAGVVVPPRPQRQAEPVVAPTPPPPSPFNEPVVAPGQVVDSGSGPAVAGSPEPRPGEPGWPPPPGPWKGNPASQR